MAKHQYRVAARGSLILPMENGGTKRLEPGQIVTGPHFAKFVGKGLMPVMDTPPKPKAAQLPAPFVKADEKEAPEAPEADEQEEAPKGEEVERSAPAEEPVAEPEPEPEPETEEEPEPKGDSLPASKSELKKMNKESLTALATELGLDSEGTNKEIAARIAKDLGL